jgi:3-dehydroquinate dehydratase-2
MKLIYVLNGPNLNLLGQREPHIYGRETLADVHRRTQDRAARLGLEVDFRQSNHEGVLIDWVQEAREKAAGLVINAGGLTHTSVALMDAVLASEIPAVEVHLSNLYKREDFRQHSYISRVATGMICGLGPKGYELALEALAERLQSDEKSKRDV